MEMTEMWRIKFTAKHFGWRWVIVLWCGDWRIRRLHRWESGWIFKLGSNWEILGERKWNPLFNSLDLVEEDRVWK